MAITAIKLLNRGKTLARATFEQGRWTVVLEGECREHNRRTVEQGYAQLLNETTDELRSQHRNQRRLARRAAEALGGWELQR